MCGAFTTLYAQRRPPPTLLWIPARALKPIGISFFNLRQQAHLAGVITEDVSWLQFTHGLNFARMVRMQRTNIPNLCSAGPLQMCCFAKHETGFFKGDKDVEPLARQQRHLLS